MKKKRTPWLLLVLMLLGLAATGRGQDGSEEPERDPFATPPPMREAATRDGKADPSTSPTSASSAWPEVKVRATLSVKGRPPGAILAVEERTLLVRPGQTVSLKGLEVEITAIEGGVVQCRTASGTKREIR